MLCKMKNQQGRDCYSEIWSIEWWLWSGAYNYYHVSSGSDGIFYDSNTFHLESGLDAEKKKWALEKIGPRGDVLHHPLLRIYNET